MATCLVRVSDSVSDSESDGMNDYSDWLTKQQAADALGVTTKTIERMADRKEIEQRAWKRPGKPALAVFRPDDIERIRQERKPEAAEGFPIPDHVAVAVSDTSQTAVAVTEGEPPADAMAAFVAAVRAVSQTSQTGVSELRHKLFLTLAEAAEYSGLPPVYLRQLVADGRLEVLRVNARGSVRIRRADLERL